MGYINDAWGDQQVVIHSAAAKEDAAISELEHVCVERQAGKVSGK